MHALDGIRVLDFTQGMAGSLATMTLADFGAEVIRIEPREGDPWWSHPAYLVWNRNKKSIQLDLTDKKALDDLLKSADVLVESFGPGRADELGVGYDDVRSINPALVYASISAFGDRGPYSGYLATDGIVNAKSGRMRDQVGWHPDRPNYRAVNDTSYHTAMFTIQGILAALKVVWECGVGQRVSTSLLAGVTAPNNPWRWIEGDALPADTYPNQQSGAAILRGELVLDRKETDPYRAIPSQLCTECKDGRWIMHSHLQVNLFRTWLKTIGFGWTIDDERYSGAPTQFARDQDRIDLNLMIVARMKEKTAAEWRDIYRANPDVAGEIMQTTQEALHHEQYAIGGPSIEVDDPRVGKILQMGPIAKLSKTPAVVGRPAPYPGQDTADVLAAPPSTKAAPGRGSIPFQPLAGVVMIELASWLAAPWSGALLADLGARVIKVEPLTGDPYRRFETNEGMMRCNQGKESIALDLKTTAGREILYRLVKDADIVMHNFRPGVPERIGIDYTTLQDLNPALVYVYASSYGSAGPDSKRAAFNPTIGAFTGNSVFQSGAENSPIGDQSPDPISGSGVATSIMLGLAAKLRTGFGQYVETTMMGSVIQCNSDDALSYAGKPERRAPDSDQLGLEATYRLYQARSGWVFLSAVWDPEFVGLCHAIGLPELPSDERFATVADRYTNRYALADLLADVFTQKSAAEWEELLTAQGVGCVQADGPGHKRFLHEDPHTAEIQLMVPADEGPGPEGDGRTYFRHAPVVTFSETPCRPGNTFTPLGNDTRKILAELGYPDSDIEALLQQKAISPEGMTESEAVR